MSKKSFLIQLQQDLMEDRKNEKDQDNPIYYGIMDTTQCVCPREFGDDAYFYDEDEGEPLLISEFYDTLTDDVKEELSADPDSGIVKSEEGFRLKDEYEFSGYVDRRSTTGIAGHKNFKVYYTESISLIVCDLFFLTRKDAEKYLEKHKDDHGKNAYVFAMTAQHSLRYERLLDLIKSIDWQKSQLVYRVSK